MAAAKYKYECMNYTVNVRGVQIPVYREHAYCFAVPLDKVAEAWGVSAATLRASDELDEYGIKRIDALGLIPVGFLKQLNIEAFDFDTFVQFLTWANDIAARAFQGRPVIDSAACLLLANSSTAMHEAWQLRRSGMSDTHRIKILSKKYPGYVDIESRINEIIVAWLKLSVVDAWLCTSLRDEGMPDFPLYALTATAAIKKVRHG